MKPIARSTLASWAPLLFSRTTLRQTAIRALCALPFSAERKIRLAWTLSKRLGWPMTVLWQDDVLATLPPSAAAERVLVVDQKVPTPDMDSGSYRMIKILDCLIGGGVPVDFVGALAPEQPHYRAALEDKGIRVLVGREALARHLLAHGAAYRTVILSRPEVAHDYLPVVRAFAVNAQVLYDTVDLHWLRFARAGEVLGDAAQVSDKADSYRRLEVANARSADLTIAITDEERCVLLAEAPDLRVVVVPNIHEIPPRVPPYEERRDLLFIGGFSHEPNVDAVQYFVSRILPRVTTQIPEIRFRILGSNMPSDIRELASLQVEPLGFVPEVEPYFEQARIFVAPVRQGAGMKGKVGQSLSFGLPVVTTSVGAEGMGLVDGENALVSDDPRGFAERIVRAYLDQALWRRLSSAGRGIIVSRFSEEAVWPQVLAIVGATGLGPPEPWRRTPHAAEQHAAGTIDLGSQPRTSVGR